jgi:hypothetical protein
MHIKVIPNSFVILASVLALAFSVFNSHPVNVATAKLDKSSTSTINALAQPKYFDDFSTYALGSNLVGWWSVYGEATLTPTIIEFGGSGPAYQVLYFPEVAWLYKDKTIIKDNLVLEAPYTVTVKVRFRQSVADNANIVIAYQDEANYISIRRNIYWSNFALWEIKEGNIATRIETTSGSMPFLADADYWFKVKAIVINGVKQVDVFWSNDGNNYASAFSQNNLANLSGRVGVGTSGPHLPPVNFDNFSAISNANDVSVYFPLIVR